MTDRWLRVWFADDGYLLVSEDDLPRVDALVSQHVDSGGTRDALVHMTTVEGEQAVSRASFIVGWSMSTPEGRQHGWEREAARREEKRQHMAAVGLYEDEDD